MKSALASLRLCCALTGMLLLLACGDRTAPNTEATTPPGMEPPSPALEGLSPEQLEQRAEAMTPEQAEELGVVDTTIRVNDEP